MPLYYFYPIYTSILGIIAFFFIPRRQILQLVTASILFGFILDILIILIIQLLGIGGYLNFGPFGFLGVPFFPPIAWTIYMTMYLYVIFHHRNWAYFLAIVSAIDSTFFSNVLLNLGIFQWNYGRLLVPFLIYSIWHVSITWIFLKFNQTLAKELKL